MIFFFKFNIKFLKQRMRERTLIKSYIYSPTRKSISIIGKGRDVVHQVHSLFLLKLCETKYLRAQQAGRALLKNALLKQFIENLVKLPRYACLLLVLTFKSL